ncbi:MAG: 7-cyano-7-deazaguanine synthase QueC [Rubrivivax sp.]|nr:7-cyano-7-deazaguanine synthase QueC [Rubrivivax sp.]
MTSSAPRAQNPPAAEAPVAARSRALVLFSGGQDSTTCLAWALQRYAHVETLGFDYGQRHRVELACRKPLLDQLRLRYPTWSTRLGEDHLLDLALLGQISDTALTQDQAIQMQASGLPSSFVPARNLIFLSFAAAIAYRRGLDVLVGGMCETDYSGYPDCRDNTLKAMQLALSLGLDSKLTIETPLMWRDKADTWRLAERLGGAALVTLIVEQTHTCYLGDHETRHAWGLGCGLCPACELRARGWAAYQAAPRVPA